MKLRLVALSVILLLPLVTSVGHAEVGAVYNLHLSTDNGPDYTDFESFVTGVTENAATPQEECIAVWRWGQRSRRQTSCATDDGRLIWDPILHYNSYGTMNCGVISGLNIASFLQLGYQARYIQLGDHTVSEVSWDDGETWHLFDSSMSFFCFNHAGQVASCQEIQESHACELSDGKAEPGHYYLYHGAPACVSHLGPDGWRFAADQPVGYNRTLINGASSYTDGFSVSEYTQYARYGRRYILNLLPGQSYTRYWRPLDRLRGGTSDKDRPDYYRPLNDGDPDDQHGLNNIRGNGEWLFHPDLKRLDWRKLFYDSSAVETKSDGKTGPSIRPMKSGQTASVTFQVSAANVITSMQIEADVQRANPNDTLCVLVSRTAGIQWTPVWHSDETGRQQIRLNLRDQVAGVTECLVKVEMSAAVKNTDVGVDSLKLTTLTQLNRRTLPKLTLGTNRVGLAADEQQQTTVLWPALHDGRYRQTVYEEQDVHCTEKPDGIYKATLGSAVDKQECSATWRLEVPTDITAVTYGVVATNRSSSSYVSLQSSFDGEVYDEFFRKSDGAFPFDKQVLHTADGEEIPKGARQAYLRTAFFCRGGASGYGMDGIQDLWIRVCHQPRLSRFAPFEVTYNWTEHRFSGDVTRSHTERVSSLPHEYPINTAGYRDPTMNWVRVSLCGSSPAGETSVFGYSDREDVGPDCEVPKVAYDWGKNLAAGCPYTVSRASSGESKNTDAGGRELTNGTVIAPTDYVTSDAVQPATAFWDAGEPVTLVVDLGSVQAVAGVCVCTHQPNPQYCHPGQIAVAVSPNGSDWTEAGAIDHNDLWKPPTDYEYWEHDDDPSYRHLPAGGRLAYRYPLAFGASQSGRYVRFVCTPLEGRGMGLSELQVFDRVQIVR